MSDIQDVELLIRHAYVITMDDERRIFEDGAVAVAGGAIVAVGEDAALAAAYRAARTIDAEGAPCHPGLVESHSHVSYQAFRSIIPDHMPEDDVFERIEQRFYSNVGEADEYASALHTGIEMIRNGTTCFLEAGTLLNPDAGAAAARAIGIRAVIGDSFIWDQPDGFAMGESQPRVTTPRIPGTPTSLAEALDRLGGQLARYGDTTAPVHAHVAVLGLGTASEELLIAAKAAASAAGVVLNMHQSYSPADTEADRRRFGADPLVHLARIGVLDRNVTLAHANYLTDAECQAVIETGATLVWAPAASMMWGHGSSATGRHAELLRRGANIALGSDSPNWSNDFDLFRQMSLAILSAREAHRQRDYLTAEDGLAMATRGGARAVGLDRLIGSLEVGKRADLVIHTMDRPELHPRTEMVRNLVYAARSKSVSTVIVDGRIVLDHGVFPHLDARAALAGIDASSLDLRRRAGIPVERNRPRA